jgi:hypothetical protein
VGAGGRWERTTKGGRTSRRKVLLSAHLVLPLRVVLHRQKKWLSSPLKDVLEALGSVRVKVKDGGSVTLDRCPTSTSVFKNLMLASTALPVPHQ